MSRVGSVEAVAHVVLSPVSMLQFVTSAEFVLDGGRGGGKNRQATVEESLDSSTRSPGAYV